MGGGKGDRGEDDKRGKSSEIDLVKKKYGMKSWFPQKRKDFGK